ncbi:hypothetical protein ACFO25_02795 [Paenactinomyces guangxiensis]|uniref:Uncharacterized protein n=1 Tax=Paenactinomyces guangxiensis TaxID=1490290 RepID=A0A7W1WTL7_9BACL|nr:hypothetical protein [Paenactinomyces guangxiensis]MBA4495611.1 hypothetical protein [Paenactinomyces guangxiensis]MBH8592599.1 hypothetical protein [Paenactinomyces guangxiensis]
MEGFWFHLLVIPGIFLLGRLSGSIKIAGFRAKPVSSRKKTRFFSRLP